MDGAPLGSEYFRTPGEYVTQTAWTTIWKEALRVDYDPIVHVTAVRQRGRKRSGLLSGGLVDAARETFKYAVKPADMMCDAGWLLELTRQLHKLRFIASGGILKDVLREEDETNDDLLVLGEGESEAGPRVRFDWWRHVRKYKRRQAIQ